MGQLRLALLGTPHIRHAEVALTFSTRKALALLVYLAVEGGLHSREKLAALFWPDSDQPHGRAMLRYTLASLRAALGDPAGPSHLIVERDALGFDATSVVEFDLHTLQVAHALARSSSSSAPADASGEAHRVIAELEQAAALYRGEFLEGFSLGDAPDFDEWASLQREAWHRKMERVFDRLSRLQADRGELAEAVETVRRWLAVSPLAEEAHRRLMRLHLAARDRTAALRAYEACRALLEKKLHVSPAP